MRFRPLGFLVPSVTRILPAQGLHIVERAFGPRRFGRKLLLQPGQRPMQMIAREDHRELARNHVHISVEDTDVPATFLSKVQRDAERLLDLTLIATAHKGLNARWRGVDSPTDVLSFPIDEETLGDIIVSVETAQNQATARSHSLHDETRILMVHGILHLLGYDHELSASHHEEMRAMEYKLLETLDWRGTGLIDSSES